MNQDFDKLGVFYLGKPYDLAQSKPLDGWLFCESKDLTTRAVCVGMTGSCFRSATENRPRQWDGGPGVDPVVCCFGITERGF